jgi:hypothetical protein
MNLPRFLQQFAVSFALLLSAALILPAAGQTGTAASSLSVSLSTLPPGARNADTISVAQVVLRNRGRLQVRFDFPDELARQQRFTFTLYDQGENVVWSDTATARVFRSGGPNTREVSAEELLPRAAWTASARIPATLDGAPLKGGVYRLEATLNGAPAVLATMPLVIRSPEITVSGISGLVLSTETGLPEAGARVSIRPVINIVNQRDRIISQPFFIQKTTGEDGRFSVELAPGRHSVTVSSGGPGTGGWSGGVVSSDGSATSQGEIEVGGTAGLLTGATTVRVEDGKMSDVTIMVRGRIDRPILPQRTFVMSVDRLNAAVVTLQDGSNVIRVSATGTVPHPGYGNPRLVRSVVAPMIAPAGGGSILFLDFLVDDPDPNFFYPMVIGTVNAEAEFPLTDEVEVWVKSRSNQESVSLRP